jgi:AraC family transcriptional regulator, melibiose operon regulatory protein
MREERRKIAAGEPPSQYGSAWFCTPTSSRFHAHYHDDLELNVVMRGRLGYRVEGVDHEVLEGGRIWLLPGALHELVEVTPGAAFWVFTFKAELDHAVRSTTGALAELPATEAELATIAQLGCRIVQQRQRDATNRALLEVLRAPWTPPRRLAPPPAHRAVQSALRCLDELQTARPMPDIAERCGLSHEHLTRLFRRELGVPPTYYRNHQRVQALIQASERGPINLLHTALDVGFGSYAQFHRAFVQVTSDGPRRRLERGEALHALPAGVTLSG